MNCSQSGRTGATKRAFTLIELLVVIAIIALLAAILFPVFGRAREQARKSACLSNLKQLGLAVQQYSQDYDEKLPSAHDMGQGDVPGCGAATVALRTSQFAGRMNSANLQPIFWADLILPYVGNAQIYRCPSYSGRMAGYSLGTASKPYASNYIYNVKLGKQSSSNCLVEGINVARVNSAAQTIQMADSMIWFGLEMWGGDGYGLGRPFLPGANTATGAVYTNSPPAITGNTSLGGQAGVTSDEGAHTAGANFLYVDGHAKWQTGANLLLSTDPAYIP